jgi:hypothetical protein
MSGSAAGKAVRPLPAESGRVTILGASADVTYAVTFNDLMSLSTLVSSSRGARKAHAVGVIIDMAGDGRQRSPEVGGCLGLAVLGASPGCLDTSSDHLARKPVFSSGSGS